MNFRIVDAHHHLWDLKALDYPWLMTPMVHPLPGLGDLAAIQKNYEIDDYLADTGKIEVVASIHLQAEVRPDLSLQETAWLNRVSEQHGLPTGIVAFLDFQDDNAEKTMALLSETRRVVGFRQIVNWDAENPNWRFCNSDLLALPETRKLLRRAADNNLRFDAQLWHGQFAQLARLADATGVKIVINHCGMPLWQNAAYLKNWRDAISVFSDYGNISIKFSGMGMFDRNWTVQSTQEIFDQIFSVFGPRRIMFGSNFPVDRMGHSYENLVDLARDLGSKFGSDFETRFFRSNAADFYGLAPISGP